MLLVTDNYRFPVLREKLSKTEYHYTIGNIKQIPCLVILVSKIDDKWLMSIEDLHYESNCSSNKDLVKKTGTIEMIQGALKAILYKHPKICGVELNDKSKFKHKNGYTIPLPEYRMIIKGRTWYQEHFGAEPLRDGLKIKLRRYLRQRKDLMKKLNSEDDLTLSMFKDHLIKAQLPQLSGEAWFISVDTIESYVVNARFEKSRQNGGFLDVTKDIDFNLYIQEIPFEAI